MKNLSFKNFLFKEKRNKEEKIRNVIDGQNLILFFKNGDKLFGAPEESRVIFAKLKTPEDDEDMPTGWEKDANFSALDLMQAMNGSSAENLFSIKDMPNINIIDKSEMEKELMKCPPSINKPINPISPGGDIGFIKIKDRQ